MSDAQELQRLAARQGWYDGRDGEDPRSPFNIVLMRCGNGHDPVPDEEDSYWRGYFDGQLAADDAQNPYLLPCVNGSSLDIPNGGNAQPGRSLVENHC